MSNGRIISQLYSMQAQALEERVDSGTDAEIQFIWNLNYVDDLLLRDRDTNSNRTLDERLYSLPDLRYCVMALADTSGSIVERFKYEVYGQSQAMTDLFVDRSSSSYDWEFRYTGRREDLETGLLFFRARFYSAQLGRFISRDPLGFVDGMNLYRGYFVPGDFDPEGTQVLDPDWPNSSGCFEYCMAAGGSADRCTVFCSTGTDPKKPGCPCDSEIGDQFYPNVAPHVADKCLEQGIEIERYVDAGGRPDDVGTIGECTCSQCDTVKAYPAGGWFRVKRGKGQDCVENTVVAKLFTGRCTPDTCLASCQVIIHFRCERVNLRGSHYTREERRRKVLDWRVFFTKHTECTPLVCGK